MSTSTCICSLSVGCVHRRCLSRSLAVTPRGRPSAPRGPSKAAGFFNSSSTRRRVRLASALRPFTRIMAKLRDEVTARRYWEYPKRIAMSGRPLHCAARRADSAARSDRKIPKQDDLVTRPLELANRRTNAEYRSNRKNPKHSGVAELTRERIPRSPDVGGGRDRFIPKRFVVSIGRAHVSTPFTG